MEGQVGKRTILGIDPGTLYMGYAVVEVGSSKDMQIMVMGTLLLDKYSDHYERLGKIAHKVTGLISEYKPNDLAIETPFCGKNVQSAIKLGRAQGTAIAIAYSQGLQVYEYAPTKIKMSITGTGTAAKEQLADILQRLLKFPEFNQLSSHYDATDAVAIAVCHAFQVNSPLGVQKTEKVRVAKKRTTWADFLSENPDRIKQ